MNSNQRKKLEQMSGQKKHVNFKNKDGSGYTNIGIVDDEVYIMVGDYKHMIQKIRFNAGKSWDSSIFGYRTCYYTYDKDIKNIKCGQFAQFLTQIEYKKLLQLAKEKGWEVF